MLEHVCVILRYAIRDVHYKSIMNRSWFTENSHFVFFGFSTDDILRMIWAKPRVIKFMLLMR